MRVQVEPFNALATAIFVLAILHTFAAARFTALAHRVQHQHDDEARAQGRPPLPSIRAEVLHFLGEIEVVFGLWAVLLMAAFTAYAGWESAEHYFGETVNYTEPLFVVVIMALAATGPIVGFAEAGLRRVASAGGATPAAWWVAILTVGPVLGSFITEPAAMTICALLLGAAILRSAAVDAAEVRHPRRAVRQRVHRRHADALRRAARADGGPPVGVGHPVHGDELRLARHTRHRSLYRGLLHHVPAGAARSRRTAAGPGGGSA